MKHPFTTTMPDKFNPAPFSLPGVQTLSLMASTFRGQVRALNELYEDKTISREDYHARLDQLTRDVHAVADTFAKITPRFVHSRFLTSCGV